MKNTIYKSLKVHNLLPKTHKLVLKERATTLFFKAIFFALALISFNSCEYPLDEEFIRQPEVLNDSVVGLTDNYHYLEVDTLYFKVGQKMLFFPKYNQNLEGYIKSAEFLLNGNKLESSSDQGYTLTMPDIPGTYDLNTKIYFITRTGSIANITNLENFTVDKKWVLIIYQLENETASYINHYFEDGRMKIEWEEFPHPFIKEYRISESTIYEGIYDLIGTSERNYFIDSTFVGYSRRYRITAVTKGNSEVFWGEFIILNDLPQMTVDNSPDACYKRKVIWNLPKAYNNVTSTLFYVNDVLQSTSYDVYDTLRYIENTIFGNKDQIHLHFTSRTSSHSTDYYSATVKAASYSGFKYTSGNSGYVYPASDNLFINVEQNEIIVTYLSSGISTGDTLFINNYKQNSFTTSPDGTQFAFLTNSGEIKSGAVNNLNQLITSPSVTQVGLLKISDNKIACVKSGSFSITFYDFNTMGEPESFNLSGGIAGITDLSSDAKFFSVKEYGSNIIVYKRENGEFTKLYELPAISDYFLKFNNINPEQFFHWDKQLFYCRNMNNGETIYSYPLTVVRILHLDITNNRMLVVVGDYIRIYRITDGTILYNIPYSIYTNIDDNSILIENKIVSMSLMYCY